MDAIIKPIVDLFRFLLDFFYNYTHSWGWAIIVLTVLIKMVLFPTMIKQFRVMSKMKDIQPKLKAIQEKYKDKPEEMQKRTMEVYQKEGVNPFGSCLPMLIQLPLLWAIFSLLQNEQYISEVIKNSHFLWFFLKNKNDWFLAIISGATTFLQQKLTTPSTGNDSQQQVFLYIMPLMLGFFTYQVNAGVGLYWVTSNIVGIAQQYLINEYFIVKEHIHKTEDNTDPDKK